jgi:hypothetical protein
MISSENESPLTGETTAEDMGGASGITGGGESGGPGEGVKSKRPRAEDQGESQGAGAADLNAGQPSIGQDDQPDIGSGGDPGGGSALND